MPATVAYGFSTERLLAWLAPLAVGDRNAGGALCGRHADAMVPPRGWWLDDRRTDAPTLFRSPEHKPAGGATDHRGAHGDDGRRRASRRPHELVVGEQLALDAEVVGEALADDEPGVAEHTEAQPVPPDEPPLPPAAPWTPAFDMTDDLGGLLDASTPLLARAFGRGRRSTTPPAVRD